MSRQCF